MKIRKQCLVIGKMFLLYYYYAKFQYTEVLNKYTFIPLRQFVQF